jgi:hypothetical protein
VSTWRITRHWDYSGPSEAGADVEGGRAFALERDGHEHQLSIDVAAGGRGVSGSQLDEIARGYLNEDVPPRRVVVDREGNVMRTTQE